MRRRLFVGFLVAALAAALLAPTASGAQESGDVTLTIGLNQDLDSPNVTAGFLVSSFELWNLQYATLTDKAADDFAVIPGLAESWETSDDGLTVTYQLRDGLTWSDGEPLTAEDVAYTINRSRDEEWLNHSAVTVNLTATAVDDLTVEIVSSVPDPKLPVMDVYIVPKHIYEPLSADDVVTYDALDGVGSGPYTLENWSPGESWTMVANPNYWGWSDDGPVIDRVVFRVFSNGDAMAAAVEQGEIDAAHNLPASSFARLADNPDVVTVAGSQGGFSELGMNAGAGGIGDGNPALLDKNVRRAIAHSIDIDTLFDRIILGLGRKGTTMSVSPDPSWQPEIPADIVIDFNPAKAMEMLDAAGYVDSDGDGVRETPDGEPFELRYAQRSESVNEPDLTQFITGWLADVGIATTVEVYDDSQLTDVIAFGNFDLFTWGWVPFVDPDSQLSYFTCDEVTYDPDDYYGYNDANWCSSTYDELYQRQKVELDPDKRREIVHEMLLHFYDEASYLVLYEEADLQAYRTDRFTGWAQQPADIGPVIFSNSSPSYVNLQLADGSGSGSDSGNGLVIGVIVAAVGAAGALSFVGLRRRGSADERE